MNNEAADRRLGPAVPEAISSHRPGARSNRRRALRWTVAATASLGFCRASAQSPGPIKIELVIDNRRKTGTPLPRFSAHRGETVLITVTTPVAGSLNLHGLVPEIAVAAGTTKDLRLVLRTAGRFPIHFHTAAGHLDVAFLEIYPK